MRRSAHLVQRILTRKHLVQRSGQEASFRGLANRALIESMGRDLAKRPLIQILHRDLAKGSAKRFLT